MMVEHSETRQTARPSFTPGPWNSIVDPHEKFGIYPVDNGKFLAIVEGQANAQLIAAAPELLDAAKGALAQHRESWKHPGTEKRGTLQPAPKWVMDLQIAIAKAEGRA